MICKECGEDKHNCGNCHPSGWGYDYCSVICMNKAVERITKEFETILDAVPGETVTALKTWYANHPYSITEMILDNCLDE